MPTPSEPGTGLGASVQSIAASLAAIAAFFTGMLAVIRRMVRRESEGGDPEGLHAVPRTAIMREKQNEKLEELLVEVGGQRALLLKAHNGGGIPKASSILKVTILAEVHARSMASVAGDYDARLLTDREYLQILARLDNEELLLLKTDELGERSLLRDEYDSEGLVAAWVCVVKRRPDAFFYLSVSSTKPFADSPEERAALRSTASRLARLLEVDLKRTIDDVTA